MNWIVRFAKRLLGRRRRATFDELVRGMKPVAYWKLNDPIGSTIAEDSSGNGLHGEIRYGRE